LPRNRGTGEAKEWDNWRKGGAGNSRNGVTGEGVKGKGFFLPDLRAEI
jgi:hypothetical protein